MEMESRYSSNLRELTKGLDKNIAQKQFIREAENMGIPTIKWEKNDDVIVPWQGCGWPIKEIKAEHGKTWPAVGMKLSSRSKIPSLSTVPGHEHGDLLSMGTQDLICNCLVSLSRLYCSLWPAVPLAKGGGGKNRRLHARAWNKT